MSEPPPSPYGSARDLPSYQEMSRQIHGIRLLTKPLTPEVQAGVTMARQQLEHLFDVVDRFYERLGPRHWIYHEWLNPETVEEVLSQTKTGEEAEQRLIELYRDKVKAGFWTRRLQSVDGLRERFHQIERAREHYEADRFDSTVLHLITVMDGFVNDFDPGRRRGLSARKPEEMVAWDSVVGHHMGLTHALKTYDKTIKKRKDEEVWELHRHGIVHGTITRFDNVVVATKAWNMLFAVVDWAEATTKSRQPEEPVRTIEELARELIEKVRETSRLRKRLDQWKPTRVTAADHDFDEFEVHALTTEFLNTWRDENFGGMARFPSRRFEKGLSDKQIAGRLRGLFEHTHLTAFQVTELENDTPTSWLARGSATVDGQTQPFELRWTITEPDGTPAFDSDSARPYLVYCDPYSLWIRPTG